MSVTRRLLVAAGGGATFAASPAGPTLAPRLLFAAPQGGGVLSTDPRAYYAHGKTHFGWSNGSTGGVELATYDHASKTMGSSNELRDLGSPETHYTSPVIVRVSDSKIVSCYAGHSDAFLYRAISPNADDTGGVYATNSDIDSSLGGTAYQFLSLVQLDGLANDPIYLFYEDRVGGGSGTSRLCYSVSTDSGATWAAQTVLFSNGTETFPSWRISSDWDSRIDFMVVPSDSYTGTPSLYHFYFDGTTWRKSDGTSMGSPTFSQSDMTLVYDGSGDGVFPAGIVTNSGQPRCIFYAKVDGTHNRIKRARWTGSAWAIDTVLSSCGVHPADRFSTGLTLLEDGATAYLGDLVSGTVEVFKYTTPDGGTTWNGTQITSSSSANNAQVTAVTRGDATFPVLWFQGTLTTSSSYNLATYGLTAV